MAHIIVKDKTVTINGKRAKKLWTGGSRPCFVGDGIIVKLNDDDLYKQSSRELRIWKTIEPCDRRYFARPIAGQIRGNGWIAQKIIKFRRGRKPRWAWKLAERLSKKYGILRDCWDHDYWKVSSNFDISINWGITHDGKFVIYDWGW